MLSVCIIAKNEEDVLEDCLLSVASIANEIILLDTGSTDNTIAIAKKYDCSIYHYNWDGKFAKARNTACSYARHEWILCVDCDEKIKYPERVIPAILTAPGNVGSIIIERHNHAITKDGKRSNEMRGNARLLRNIPEVYWSYEVHEEPWSSCINNGLLLLHSNIVMDHEVWRPGASGYFTKQKYYEGLLKRYASPANEQHYLFHIAKTRMLFEDYQTAIQIFDRAESANGYQIINDAFLKCYRGYSYYLEKDYDRAEEDMLHALALTPGLSAANFYLISLYLAMGKYDKALDCAGKLVLTESLSKPLTVADIYFKQFQINYWKAKIILQTGDTEGAKNLLMHDNYDFDSAMPLSLLSRIAFMQGNKNEALMWINEAIKCNPQWQHLQMLQQQLQ